MNKKTIIVAVLIISTILLTCTGSAVAEDDPVIEVQKYDRAIHVMAMLLAGFGFLMVLIRGHGKSALTATMLLVSLGISLYIIIKSIGIFGHAGSDIDMLILAEFAAASLLICTGAVLGRLKMPQYLFMALLFIPFYMLNE